MNVILLQSDHRHVSATHMAIFKAVRTRIQKYFILSLHLPEGAPEIHGDNVRRDSRCTSRELNQAPPQYTSEGTRLKSALPHFWCYLFATNCFHLWCCRMPSLMTVITIYTCGSKIRCKEIRHATCARQLHHSVHNCKVWK